MIKASFMFKITAFAVFAAMLSLPGKMSFAATATIDTNTIINNDFHGYGLMFNSEQLHLGNRVVFGTTEATFQSNLVPLLRELSPKIIKMALPVAYWEPELGQETYNSDWMEALYKVLDEFKYEGAEIQFQEWRQQRSPWCEWGEDPWQNVSEESIDNFARSMTKFLKHLVMEKGYYNIRAICIWNEPTNFFYGNALMFQTYHKLAKYFKQEGLEIHLNAPDVVQVNRCQPWQQCLNECFTSLDSDCQEFSYNLYAEAGGWIAENAIYDGTSIDNSIRIRGQATVADQLALSPTGVKHPIYVYEGEANGKGALNGAYFIEIARSGISGVTKWFVMDHYFCFSWGAFQTGTMLWKMGNQYEPTPGGDYWANCIAGQHTFQSATVYGITESAPADFRVACFKDNDSDSYAIFVHNRRTATSITFSMNNGLNRTFQKFVHPGLTSAGNVTMTNGSLTDNVAGSNFTVYYSAGAKETTPPSTPGTVTAAVINPHKVKLTWGASTDNVRVTRYNVYRNGGATPVISINGKTWEDSHVNPGTSYIYVVKAVDGAGNESTNGATATVNVPQTTTQAPSVPQNLKVVDSVSEIEITWTPSTDDVGVAGYRVYEQLQGESVTRVSEIRGVGGNAPKTFYFSHNGFASCNRENVNHYISVSAIDDEGNESARSSIITVLIPYGIASDFDNHYDFCGNGNGILHTSVANFSTDQVGLNASQIKQVWVKLKNPSTSTRNQLRVVWNGGANSVTTPITTNDTDYKDYVVDLSGQSSWSGQINNMSVDFLGGSSDTGMDTWKFVRIGTFPFPKPTASKTTANVAEIINFSGTGSTPPPGGVINQYLWDFGDGNTATGSTSNHSFTAAGIYTVKLKCVQDALIWGEDSIVINVGNPAPATVTNLDVVGVTKTRIDIFWYDNTESDIASYKIYRSLAPNFIPSPSNLVATKTSADYYHCDTTGLSANTQYFYKITAVDNAGQESVPCDSIGAYTRANDSLIPNGDFEAGNINGWQQNGGAWSMETSALKYNGNYSIKTSVGAGVNLWLSQTFTTIPGRVYRFIAFYNVTSHTWLGDSRGWSFVACDFMWSPIYAQRDHIWGSRSNNKDLGTWGYETFEFTALKTQTLIMMMHYLGDDALDIAIDDVYLDLVPQAGVAPNKPTALKCDGQSNPLNVTNNKPVLSWTFSDNDAGDTQSAYQLLISTNANNLNADLGDAWNSGKILSSLAQATYNGRALQLGKQYYWKVKTWDSSDQTGPYADAANFTMSSTNNPPNAPSGPKCNGLTNPSGITNFIPNFSWTFSDNDAGNTQSAYQLLVADTLNALAGNTGTMWDTGKVTASANTAAYNGSSLQPGGTYYWKVRTWDNFDTAGNYCPDANFSMTVPTQQNTPPNAPQSLKCDGVTDPPSLSNKTPSFSWTFSDNDTGDAQSAYQLLVADNQNDLSNNTGNAWDTGKVNQSVQTAAYGGAALQDGVTYYWKVTTWDSYLAQGSYSLVASYTMSRGGAVLPTQISLSSSTLDFGEVEMNTSKIMTLVISNSGGGTITGTISSNYDWIQLDKNSFSGTTTIEVTVDNAVLNQKDGAATGTIDIISNGGNATVQVKLTATCVLVKPSPVRAGQPITFFGDGIVPGNTVIRVYSLNGELIASLSAPKDSNEIKWNAGNIASGIYIYVYESPKEKGINKFTVTK